MIEKDGIIYNEVIKFIHSRIELHSELNNKNYRLSMYDVLDDISEDLEQYWGDENHNKVSVFGDSDLKKFNGPLSK